MKPLITLKHSKTNEKAIIGYVEDDGLRRGGWVTQGGLSLLVGDKFRLVSISLRPDFTSSQYSTTIDNLDEMGPAYDRVVAD